MSGAVEGVALLPCPFCGNDDPLCYPVEEGSPIHRGGCGNADCILFDDLPGNFTSRDHFAQWWNTRTTPPARSYADGVEDAAKVAEAYTEVNFEAAGDSVLLDPVLRGKGFSAENMAKSERQQIAGLVHSSQAHAGKHLAAAIRLLSQGEKA